MKIAFWHFYTFRFMRGIETLILGLGNALVQKGVEVSIISASPKNVPLIPPDPKIKIYSYSCGRYFSHAAIVPFYLYHFARHRYDFVFTFFADFGEASTWKILRRFQDLPLALYLCYAYSTVPHRYESFLKLNWHREAKHIFADSAWIAEEASKLFVRPVTLLPFGVDAHRFRPDTNLRRQMRQRYGYSDNEVVLLNVSALEIKKGCWRGIDAFARLHSRHPGLRYFLLGRGEDEARLRRMVNQLGLGKTVIFGGETAELEKFYNMADIFMMLPDAESNSIACHEAMSCGLPVVVSQTIGFSENIPKEAGVFVPPDDPHKIDQALELLIGDPNQRRSLGKAGRCHILNHGSWDQSVAALLAQLYPKNAV